MENKKPSYIVVPSRNGPPTLLVTVGGKEVPLHSRFDPAREAGQHADFFNPDRYDVLVILGTGLGYHLMGIRPLIKRYTRIICVDILEGIEDHVKENSETSFLSASGRVVFLSGVTIDAAETEIASLIDLERIKGVSVMEHPVSMRLFGEYYGALKKSIEGIINKKAGDTATIRAFGPLFFRNIAKNLRNLGNHRWVGNVSKKFTRYAALVVTAGPSLDDAVSEIRDMQKNLFVIAVDSALPVLRGHGIEPDFVVSIDPQVYIREHFRKPLYETIPVFSLSVSPLLFSKYRGLVSLDTHPLSQVLEREFPDAGSIDSRTGTVAGDAIQFARLCGFSRVGLVGFDFSFPRYSIYARGTAYQYRYGVYFQNRLLPVETSNMGYIRKSNLRHGNLYTRRSFLQYRDAVERLIREVNSAGFVSVKGEGIPLAGVLTSGLDEFNRGLPGNSIDKKMIIANAISSSPNIDAGSVASVITSVSKEPFISEILTLSLPPAMGRGRKFRLVKLLTESV